MKEDLNELLRRFQFAKDTNNDHDLIKNIIKDLSISEDLKKVLNIITTRSSTYRGLHRRLKETEIQGHQANLILANSEIGSVAKRNQLALEELGFSNKLAKQESHRRLLSLYYTLLKEADEKQKLDKFSFSWTYGNTTSKITWKNQTSKSRSVINALTKAFQIQSPEATKQILKRLKAKRLPSSLS